MEMISLILLNVDHIVKSSLMLIYESLNVKRLFCYNIYSFCILCMFRDSFLGVIIRLFSHRALRLALCLPSKMS
jgi:hypothetical protein